MRKMLIVFLILLISMNTASAVKVYVDPPNTKGPSFISGIYLFDIDVRVQDVSDLAGFEFKLYWDNTILDCVNVESHPENLWDSNYIQWKDSLNQSVYYVSYTRKDSSTPTFSGNASLATLTFKVKAEGYSLLNLTGVKLGDSNAYPIYPEVEVGTFSNKQTGGGGGGGGRCGGRPCLVAWGSTDITSIVVIAVFVIAVLVYVFYKKLTRK